MSMTSKVNPTLRQEIVDYLASTGYGTSNLAFVYELRQPLLAPHHSGSDPEID